MKGESEESYSIVITRRISIQVKNSSTLIKRNDFNDFLNSSVSAASRISFESRFHMQEGCLAVVVLVSCLL